MALARPATIWPRVALRDAPAWFSSSSSVSATPPAAGSSLILFVIYMASGKAVVLDWLRPSEHAGRPHLLLDYIPSPSFCQAISCIYRNIPPVIHALLGVFGATRWACDARCARLAITGNCRDRRRCAGAGCPADDGPSARGAALRRDPPRGRRLPAAAGGGGRAAPQAVRVPAPARAAPARSAHRARDGRQSRAPPAGRGPI